MTWRRLLVDGPVALWDHLVAAVTWLEDLLADLLRIWWLAYWLCVTLGAAACWVAVALVVLGANIAGVKARGRFNLPYYTAT